MLDGVSKIDLVGYIAGLISIINSQDAAGNMMQGGIISREIGRAQARLEELIGEEEKQHG